MSMQRSTPALAALLAIGTLLTGGCGAGTEAASNGDDAGSEDVAEAVDEEGMATGVTSDEAQGVCDFLTEEDIEDVIGKAPVGEAVEEQGTVGATFPSCTWTLPGPEKGLMAGENATLQLVVLTPAAYERQRTQAGSLSGTEPVEGVGEEAWVQLSGSSVPSLYVLADGQALGFAHFLVFPQGVELEEATVDAGIEAQAELARRALERI